MGEAVGKEKRAIRRFALQLPVTVTTQGGQSVQAEAESRDVSSHGICFYCDSRMEKDTQIEFTVMLPTEVTMTEPISVRCNGRVVRVEESGAGGKFAVAAEIDNYEFVASDDKQELVTDADLSPSL